MGASRDTRAKARPGSEGLDPRARASWGTTSGTLVRRLVRPAACAAAAVMAVLWSLPGTTVAASTNGEREAVVRAVLFYSPTCPHCHSVMTESLSPLQAAYGSRLQILAVDVTDPAGSRLYDAAVAQFQVPAERRGVPALYVGDTLLVGSAEIPQEFPSLVERLMASGGSDWPAIPGLADTLASLPSSSISRPADSVLSEAIDRAARDPAGSALSVTVLLGLLASLAWAGMTLRRSLAASPEAPSAWIPLIGLGGLAVAAYMAGVETTGSPAVCGPVGDCNRVHESDYARLFGVLPIGVLGCAGYGTILVTWLAGRLATGGLAELARLGIFALAALGVLFSAYLTFLEPFVIGATCAWCLASAVLMGAILVVATASMWPRRRAGNALRTGRAALRRPV
jgi:uncharacterized membrane protein/thiol-disulfide isomerase/thioredoxin